MIFGFRKLLINSVDYLAETLMSIVMIFGFRKLTIKLLIYSVNVWQKL